MHIYVCEKRTEMSICALFSTRAFCLSENTSCFLQEQITLGSFSTSAATLHCHTSVLQQMNMSPSEKSRALLFRARVLLITCSQLVNNSKISRQPSEKDSLILASSTMPEL